jgi:hypothetical protein
MGLAARHLGDEAAPEFDAAAEVFGWGRARRHEYDGARRLGRSGRRAGPDGAQVEVLG